MKRYKIYKKKRNALARELEEKKYRPRTVHPRKIYDRAKERRKPIEDSD